MTIDYQVLIDEAMLGIVQKVLYFAQDEGLEKEQCFYISFRTDYPEVILSKTIKAKYPKEITIILQYQYQNLRVLKDRFSVNVAFNGINETIEVPFLALTAFSDPSVNFSLQFKHDEDQEEFDESLIYKSNEVLKLHPRKLENKSVKKVYDNKKDSGKVVSIENFRKK